MAVSLSSLAQLVRRALPKKKAPATEAGLSDDAVFRKKYGIAPKGTAPKGGWPASAYGFPVPPADHPQALRYARAVLSRAHMSKKYARADLQKQIGKAQAIVKKHDKSYTPSKSASKMAKGAKESFRTDTFKEYIPSTPPGSWERLSGLIQKAAQASALFGGPGNDDPEENSAETVRSWNIFIYASYPAKNTVIIANDKLGKMWSAQYDVDDAGNITFAEVKPTQLAFQTEARRDTQRKIAVTALESGIKRDALKMIENVLVVGGKKLREAIALSGSAEDQANRTHAQAKALRKHVRALGKAVAASPCPCGRQGHKPSLMATFPDSKSVVTSCPQGLHSSTYAIKDGKFTMASGTPVEATIKKARAKESALRESATDKNANASLHFYARIREAKVTADGAQAVCVMLEEGPGNPADRHFYPGETLKDAVEAGIFEGAHTFADHPTAVEDRIRPERSVRDLIGWWSDVRVEEADGKVAMVGTYNLESGNDFALNKMREAKRYAESNPEKPGYVGFSIAAAGVSHTQEIDGKSYNVVDRITEAVSTDMVTRAGAGGKLLSLKEAMVKTKTIALDEKRARKIAESAASAAVKKALKENNKRIKDALESIGVDLTPEQDEALDKELGVVDGGAIDSAIDKATGQDDDQDDDTDESDTMEDILGGQDDDQDDDDSQAGGNSGGADEDDDQDDDDEDDAVEGRKKKESAALKVAMRENARLKEQNKKLLTRESLRNAKSQAIKICEALKVPTQARAYVMNELLECKDEKAMKERAKALLEGIIRPVYGDGIDGAPARMAESTSLIAL